STTCSTTGRASAQEGGWSGPTASGSGPPAGATNATHQYVEPSHTTSPALTARSRVGRTAAAGRVAPSATAAAGRTQRRMRRPSDRSSAAQTISPDGSRVSSPRTANPPTSGGSGGDAAAARSNG